MAQKARPPRTEYLSMAAIVIVIAVVIVIVMIASSAGGTNAASSDAITSELESSEPVNESSEEESSVPENTSVEIPSSSASFGLVAITKLPADGSEPDMPTDLVSVYSEKNDTFGLSGSALRLRKDAMNALNDFLQAFTDVKGKTNIVLHKGYAKRSELATGDEERQVDLTTGNGVYFTIYPADRDGDTIGSGKFTWLADNCSTYGFILRYPDEKSQYTGQSGTKSIYRFVGYTHASYMGKYHYSLEEYLSALKSNTSFENPAQFSAGGKDGNRACLLYYVPASDAEQTSVPLPNGASEYEISGNGTDGFVVIVYLDTPAQE